MEIQSLETKLYHELLKDGVTTEDLNVYELYVQRIMKEGDWIWSRFKIYLGFNSGVIAIMGFITRPYLSGEATILPARTLVVVYMLSLIGFVFSVAWYLVNADGAKWQNVMRKKLVEVERGLFKKTDYALFKEIDEVYEASSPKRDNVIQLNAWIPCLFAFVWVLLAALAAISSIG